MSEQGIEEVSMKLALSLLIVSCCLALPTWEGLGPHGGRARDVAFAPSNENIAYALTLEAAMWPYLPPRVFRTTDNADTWTQMSILSDSLRAYSLAIHPTNPDILYVAGNKATVFKSTDAGATWTLQSLGVGDTVHCIMVHPSSPSNLFACGTIDPVDSLLGIFKSTDGGASWQVDTLDDTLQGVSDYIVTAPSNHNIMYLGASDPFWYSGTMVFKSTDGGATWMNVTNNLHDPGNELWGIYCMAVHETNPDIVYVATINEIWHTTDGGSTWSLAVDFNHGNSPIVCAIATTADNPSVLFATIDSALYQSSDAGTTWAYTGTGYYANWGYWYRAYGLAIKDSDESFVLAANDTPDGLFRTTNGGVSWDTATAGITMSRVSTCQSSNTAPATMYAQRHHMGVSRSTDYGSTWTNLPDFTSGCLVLCGFAFHRTNANTVLTLEGMG
jgi:photosystem II stability/assembly factor-like uncharacterized protein